MHYFSGTPILLLCVSYAIATIAPDDHIKWPTLADEALDEMKDADLLKAVQQSMREWSVKSHKNQRKKRAVKRVCYGELGCFEDSGPFSYLETLPSPPDDINTKFYFYSTKNRSDRPLLELPFLNMTEAIGRSLDENNSWLSENGTSETTTPFTKTTLTLDDLQGFDELSLRVIVHGFGSACPHVWIYEMKTALMAVENCIVICVDWENGANFPNYVRAAANTRLVGKQLAMLLRNLRDHKGLKLSKTHIIGFSLGAHVAGFAGAELPGLKRITGLDPAGPLFEAQHPKARLDNTDAEFVDVIHSNGENLILGGLGSWQPMGHVDFYPNGGRVQTGCSNLFVGAVTDFIWSQAAENEGRSLCNHRRAYKFFIDSVAPRCLFPAFPCESYEDFLEGNCFPCGKDGEPNANGSYCGNMGYYADRSTGRGQLYLVTREEEPFCAHQFHIEIHNSFNDLPLRTIGKIDATLEGEGGLNETFLITEKEDTEFFAGDIVSKIIVPHPALGFPTKLTLQYKSYSGWLSKGLPHWDIDKIALIDSFGRIHSLCKPLLSLSSGIPVHFDLMPGNCELPEENDQDSDEDDSLTYTTTEGLHLDSDFVTQANEERFDTGEDGVESVKTKKDIFNLGTNYKINRNQTYTFKREEDRKSHELPWQPILEGNSLDKDTSESGRSLQSDTTEIFEPILKNSGRVKSKGRNMHNFDEKTEVVEPVLKPKNQRRRVKQISIDQFEPKSSSSSGEVDGKEKDSSGPIMVQLFPFRLGELLERAERYARETLLPLISEQAPKFFGFGSDRPAESDRKPRYIPRYEELAFTKSLDLSRPKNNNEKFLKIDSTSTITPQQNKVLKKGVRDSKDLVFSASREHKNILEFNRSTVGISEQRSSYASTPYYTNKVGSGFNLSESFFKNSKSKVHIDLPTYRPMISDSRTVRSVKEDTSDKT